MMLMKMYRLIGGYFIYLYGKRAMKIGNEHHAAHAAAMMQAGICRPEGEARDQDGRPYHENRSN